MKIASKILAAVALAAALTATSQASGFTYNNGDVLLGLINNGNSGSLATNALVIDLGSYSSIKYGNFNGLNLDISSDLTAAFGASWSSNTNGISYGLIGGVGPISVNELLVGSTYKNNAIISLRTTDVNGTYAAAAGDVRAVGSTVTSGTATASGYYTPFSTINSWAQFSTFGPNGPAGGNTVSAEFDGFNVGQFQETLGVAKGLYVFGIQDANVTPFVGQITISSAGVVTAVPEPSTYVLFGLGALLLMVIYRRRKA